MEHAARGKKALEAKDYDEAITAYSAALKVSPTSPDYLIQRSTAYHRAKKYADALYDANNAVLNAQARAKRELIVEAQFRRGCAYYGLERYGDAEFVFGIVRRMQEKHKMIATWEQFNKNAVAKLEPGDKRRVCNVEETPKAEEVTGPTASEDKTSSNGGTQKATKVVALPSAPQQTAPEKIRHEWYQNSENVYFTLLAKGVPQDEAHIDIQERSVSISFPLASGATYDLTLEPLFATVKPEASIPRILSTKIEIVLAKATPGQKWSALESSEPISSTKTDQPSKIDPVPRAVLTSDKPTGPAYPTSSKSGPKNWDKITEDLRTGDKEDGKAGAVDDDDFEGGDEADHFFKKLFKNASPEAQRAMMKSYTESNGTALSTNWEEVKKGPVETTPPDGMEAKAWKK